jgi:hypothetical protein
MPRVIFPCTSIARCNNLSRIVGICPSKIASRNILIVHKTNHFTDMLYTLTLVFVLSSCDLFLYIFPFFSLFSVRKQKR